jgi:hypothetical protein
LTRSSGSGKTIDSCACAPRYYGPNAGPCKPCPRNFFCPGGSVRISCETVKPGTSSQNLSASASDCNERRFVTANIGQSTTVPSASNTLGVTLRTETESLASELMVVTISGLLCDGRRCILCNNATQLDLKYSSPTEGSNVYHTAQYLVNGDLQLSLISDLEAGAETAFTFCLQNPTAAQYSPSISVESSGISIPKFAMNKSLNGAAPLSVAGFHSATYHRAQRHICLSIPSLSRSKCLPRFLPERMSLSRGLLVSTLRRPTHRVFQSK